MRLRTIVFPMLLLLLAMNSQAADVAPAAATGAAASVFRLVAYNGNRHATNGSAVLVAQGNLVTACHVVRRAQSIVVGRDGRSWPARFVGGDFARDICFVHVPALADWETAQIGDPDALRRGDPVTAIGYPHGGNLSITRGRIIGLHPHDGAAVLQVSAPFEHGQSGGALFDFSGRLIGITAFKAIAGGDYHFALPLPWLHDSAVRAAATQHTTPAFWERARDGQPLFLRAASLEADRKWKHLSGVAEEWVLADAGNPASWLCLARALKRLERADEAQRAFDQARALDPSLDTRLTDGMP